MKIGTTAATDQLGEIDGVEEFSALRHNFLRSVLFDLFMTTQVLQYDKNTFHEYVLPRQFYLQITDNTPGFARYMRLIKHIS